MTRVIHTGDTHVGYQQYHSPERRRDFLAAFEQVADDAVADDVDAVVHAGDLFHDRRPDLRDLLGTLDVLRTLRDADVPFLAVVGNHEGTRHAQWLDLFESLGLATRLDESGVAVGDTTFYGLDYVPESRRDDLDYRFDPPETEHAALVSHGLFTPFPHADWETETVLSESNVDFDAVLLGDNHHPDRAEVDGTWVTYCGSTERASADERDERGYNIVEFDGGVAVSRRGLDTRPFRFVDCELAAGEGPGRVRERIREVDTEGAVVVVTVEGDGEDLTPAEVEAFGDEQGALLTRVNDRRDREDPDAPEEVAFADPDEVVRERVREMGLSSAARDVDEAVRDDGLADSNVRETVSRAVEERLDDGDVSDFDPPDDGTAGDGDDGGEADVEPGDDPAVEDSDPEPEPDPDPEAGAEATAAESEATTMEDFL